MRLNHIIKPNSTTTNIVKNPDKHQAHFISMIDEWLKSLYRENYSINTILAYQASLYRFSKFVAKNTALQGNWQACQKNN